MARLAAFFCLATLGCTHPKPAPAAPSPSSGAVRGTLALEIDPADAEVEVDGAPRGKARSIELEPGPHQIVIKKPGFEIWRGEVELAKATETIQVKLVPTAR